MAWRESWLGESWDPLVWNNTPILPWLLPPCTVLASNFCSWCSTFPDIHSQSREYIGWHPPFPPSVSYHSDKLWPVWRWRIFAGWEWLSRHIRVFLKYVTVVRILRLRVAEICPSMLSHVKIAGDIWTATAGLVSSSPTPAHLMNYYMPINI